MWLNRLVLLAAVLTSSGVQAQSQGPLAGGMILKNLQPLMSNENTQTVLSAYFRGIYDGVQWTNALTKQDGGTALFCLPPKFGLNNRNLLDIVEQELKAKVYADDTELSLIMLVGLKRTFPC